MGTQTRSLSRNTIPLKVLWEFCQFPAPKKSTHKKTLVFCERSGYWFNSLRGRRLKGKGKGILGARREGGREGGREGRREGGREGNDY